VAPGAAGADPHHRQMEHHRGITAIQR
jgi:hypothetical protein